MEWYYMADGEKRGPVSDQGLQDLVYSGDVHSGTQVWSPDLPGWQPASEVPGLELEDFRVTRPDEGTFASPHENGTPERTSPRRDGTGRPWRRYFARMIDAWLLAFVWGMGAYLVLAMTSPGLADTIFESSGLLFYALMIGGMIPLEALLISSFGTTPGKWLLGLDVVSSDGSTPSFEGAIQRTALVWWRGVALGIPIVALFTMIHAKDVLDTAGVTTWDRDTGHRVEFTPLARLQQGAWGVLVILFVIYLA